MGAKYFPPSKCHNTVTGEHQVRYMSAKHGLEIIINVNRFMFYSKTWELNARDYIYVLQQNMGAKC
jgi:hypothetical protein